jgi:hypothetical protein
MGSAEAAAAAIVIILRQSVEDGLNPEHPLGIFIKEQILDFIG